MHRRLRTARRPTGSLVRFVAAVWFACQLQMLSRAGDDRRQRVSCPLWSSWGGHMGSG